MFSPFSATGYKLVSLKTSVYSMYQLSFLQGYSYCYIKMWSNCEKLFFGYRT